MDRIATKSDGPKLVAWASSGLVRQAESLVSGFDATLQSGTRYATAETIQIGWMIVTLREDRDANLELWEPDFQQMPIRWVRGVDTTLRHMTLQREVCACVGVEPRFQALNQPAVLTPSLVNFGGNLHMERKIIDGDNAEWLFRPAYDDGSEALLQSLYQIALSQPRIIPFLALPGGTEISHAVNNVAICIGDQEFSSTNTPFLRRLTSIANDR